MIFERNEISSPVSVSIKDTVNSKTYSTSEHPQHCKFPIRDVDFNVIEDDDCMLSTQEVGFIGNHLTQLEVKAQKEVTLALEVKENSVFFVIVLEGFFRYYREGQFAHYAIGRSILMTYTPRSIIDLKLSQGKHSIIVVKLDRRWFKFNPNVRFQLAPLFQHLEEGSEEVLQLPMCRSNKTILNCITGIHSFHMYPFKRIVELSLTISELAHLYFDQLARRNIVNSKLSPEMANRIFVYVQQHYYDSDRMTSKKICKELDISEKKLGAYVNVLFNKSISSQFKDLRSRDKKVPE